MFRHWRFLQVEYQRGFLHRLVCNLNSTPGRWTCGRYIPGYEQIHSQQKWYQVETCELWRVKCGNLIIKFGSELFTDTSHTGFMFVRRQVPRNNNIHDKSGALELNYFAVFFWLDAKDVPTSGLILVAKTHAAYHVAWFFWRLSKGSEL